GKFGKSEKGLEPKGLPKPNGGGEPFWPSSPGVCSLPPNGAAVLVFTSSVIATLTTVGITRLTSGAQDASGTPPHSVPGRPPRRADGFEGWFVNLTGRGA